MSDTTLELESLLREKEELVEALTERLEQAAEQLDRLQRANGDRGRWMSGGIPAELVEQQRAACDDLERVVQQWEEAQPTAALARIEMQVQELRDLIVRHPAGVRGAPLEESPRRSPVVAAAPAPSDSGLSAWESLKAGLLGQNPPEDGVTETCAGQPASQDAAPAGPDPFDGEPLEAPDAVDLELAGAEELRKAIVARDDFIAELLHRLRSAESRTRPADTWKSLESTPDEVRARLESLERRLEQTLRLTEVELSLERAKLGREAVRLKQLEENATKAMDRLGLAMADDEDADDPDDPVAASADGRWMRMLGIKREK